MRGIDCLPALVLAAVAAVPALAAEDLADAIRACRSEADDARRLACYDRAAGAGGAALEAPAAATAAAPAAAAAPVAPAPAAAAPSEDDFGRERQMEYEEEQKRSEASRAVGELESSITAIEKRIDGLMTFTLDNGQVWRQVRPDSRFSIKEGDAIRIQPGSLGSYILSGPTKKSTRVTRVK